MKISALVLLAVLCCSAYAADNSTQEWTEEQSLSYYVRGLRGFWFGYIEGVYN